MTIRVIKNYRSGVLTASIKQTLMNKQIPVDENLFVVIGLQNTDGRSYFLNVDVYDQNADRIRAYQSRMVKISYSRTTGVNDKVHQMYDDNINDEGSNSTANK